LLKLNGEREREREREREKEREKEKDWNFNSDKRYEEQANKIFLILGNKSLS